VQKNPFDIIAYKKILNLSNRGSKELPRRRFVMFKKIILMVIAIVVIRGIGYATFQYLNPEPISKETMTIKVYFNNINLNPNLEDCSKVYLLNRIIPKTLEVAKAALKELFKGPTEEEKSQGYTSWFSKETQDILKSVKVKNGTAYVDLKDLRPMIPNASTSCGSAEFFAEVEITLQQFPTVAKVIFAIDGKPATFYEWMQIGCYEENDFCDETPFKTFDRDTEEEAKKIIGGRTHKAILAIKNKDTKKLSNRKGWDYNNDSAEKTLLLFYTTSCLTISISN
jgi:hypothetical protein